MTKTNSINKFELTSTAIHPTAEAVGFLADLPVIHWEMLHGIPARISPNDREVHGKARGRYTQDKKNKNAGYHWPLRWH